MALGDIVDLTHYPIDDLDGHGAALVEYCRDTLCAEALCVLPNFVHAAALTRMVDEVLSRQDKTYHVENLRSMYSWLDATKFPDDHIVNLRTANHLDSIIRDDLPSDGLLNQLYEMDEVVEFCRRCLGFDSLYRVMCPHLSLNVKVMGKGARHAWHFDQNDGVFSLLLQAPRGGGHYEYAPYIRSDHEENYAAIRALVAGDRSLVKRVDIKPGSFCLFRGSQSLHRVSPITAGSPDRLIALFSYTTKFGLSYTESTLRTVLGCVPRRSEKRNSASSEIRE